MKSIIVAIVVGLLVNSPLATASEADKAFIKGFIVGAAITDETIVKRLELNDTEWSSFEERAFRTRLGRRDRSQPATYYAEFCLPAKKTIDTVSTEVLAAIGKAEVTGDSVYQALKTLYPCTIRDKARTLK